MADEPTVEVLTPSDDDLAIHAKYFIIDDRKVFVGSQNWSYPAVESNHELGLLIENEQTAGAYTYIFESDWEAAGGCLGGGEVPLHHPGSRANQKE